MAANANLPQFHCSGSGIYAGRLGALSVFVSLTASTKILIANVPIERDSSDTCEAALSSCGNEPEKLSFIESHHEIGSDGNEAINKVGGSFLEALNRMSEDNTSTNEDLYQEDLTKYTVLFLDFSKNKIQNGSVCTSDTCCHYSIEVQDMGENNEKVCFCRLKFI